MEVCSFGRDRVGFLSVCSREGGQRGTGAEGGAGESVETWECAGERVMLAAGWRLAGD